MERSQRLSTRFGNEARSRAPGRCGGFGPRSAPGLLLLATLLLPLSSGVAWAQNDAEGVGHERFRIERAPDVPELPFSDNPDPLLCGIPYPFGTPNRAFLNGYYEGEPIQTRVLLYDSHLRRSVVGGAPHGTEVTVLLYQENPELDYYLVRTVGLGDEVEGWLPAPFLRFPDEPDPAGATHGDD